MAEKKPILAEALLDIKNIQAALNANTKEILRSVAKEEIDSVVKESILKEEDFEEEDLDTDIDAAIAEPEIGADVDAAIDGEESTDDMSDIVGSEEVVDAAIAEPEIGMDADALNGDTIDMTASSDDDVIAIYKKLSGDDEIEIVGDEIHLNISEPGEYVVKTNDVVGGEADAVEADVDTDGVSVADLGDLVDDLGPEDAGVEAGTEDDSEVDYEIEMDDDNEEGEEVEGGEEEEEETEELQEAIPVGLAQSKRLPGKADIGQPRGAGAQNESVKSKANLISEADYKKLVKESNNLKTENEEFRQALKKFRGMLVETVVFNSNLTYVTKLFMEHSTTKAEKQSIMGRFDNEVSNLKESKKLYKAIASQLTDRKPVNESVENKITKEVATSTSKQLNESTAYVDPSTKRIIDLINRVEQK